jgi:hypothetical protein
MIAVCFPWAFISRAISSTSCFGIDDLAREYRDILFRDALVNQNFAVVFFLAHEMNAEVRKFLLRANRVADPHFRRVTRFVNIRSA